MEELPIGPPCRGQLAGTQIDRGFGMSVLALDSARDARAAETLPLQFAPRAELRASSDVVTLRLPEGPVAAI